MRQIYRLPAGAFRMRQVYRLPAGAFCMRQVYLLPAGAFCMRQVRGGEAFIVAKAMLPSSRSPPPGHAAVLRCGMCCFAGEVMYSTVLVVVGCADMSGCSTVISLLTNTNTISHNLSIILHHIPHYNDTLNHIHKHSSTKNTGNRPATRAAFPSALIHRLSLASSILSNPSPHQKRHTHHNVRSKKACPERGSARGKYAGFATPSAFPLANFRRETIPGFPPLYHSDTFAFIH